MNSPVFSFIVPTRRRTDQLRRLLDSIRATTRHPARVEVILVIDQDDEESAGFRYDGLLLKHVSVEPGLTMGALNMSGYRAAAGRYLQLMNDDVVLRTPGWDEQVLAAFRSFSDGIVLVHVNDLFFHDSLSTFPFLTREFCSLLGGICPKGYVRYCIDDHIHNIFDLLSLLGRQRRLYLPEVIFEHTNVEVTAEAGRQYVSDPVIQQQDKQLFDALLEDRKRIAVELMQYIEGRLQLETPSIWKKTLETVTDSAAIHEPARWFPLTTASPDKRPAVTIGIMSADLQSVSARKCVELVRAYTLHYQLLLSDSQRDPNFNRAREINRFLSACRTDHLVLLHDEVWVQPGWLDGLLRGLAPEVGVVTPLHRDRLGHVSYAGIVLSPDDTGRYSPIRAAPSEVRRIQTLGGACLLIDVPKCGHIRLDESGTNDFASLDYGLRVWEEGFQVVCSPHSVVMHDATHDATRSQLPEEQRQRYVRSWVDSGRIERLRRGPWKGLPEISWIDERAAMIDKLLQDGGPGQREEFVAYAAELVRGLADYPALLEYLARRSRAQLGGRVPRADDPPTEHLAIVLGLAGESFEPGSVEALKATPAGQPPETATRPVAKPSCTSAATEIRPARVDASLVTRLSASLEARHQTMARLSELVAARGRAGASLSHPLAHFLSAGAYEGRRPNPLFDPIYYLVENPEVAVAGLNPLAHFLEVGAQEGRRPNPLFDVVYYLREHPEVAKAGINPLEHFLEVGAAQACKPNPLFDTAYYLAQNPDVAAAGINPLAHFLEVGAKEGRRPNPLFDTAYYFQQNPDVRDAGVNPLAHFLEFGAPEGRRPNPFFDTARYMEQHPELAKTGVNPLAHFLDRGTAAEDNSTLWFGEGATTVVYASGALVPLSVVIPTHNRSSLLAQTLEACRQQAGGCELEIIVVDDGSTDDTRQRLSRLAATMPNLLWHSTVHRGLAQARNLGADAARHDVILFLSDDLCPGNLDFFRVHASLHARYPNENLAVLGSSGNGTAFHVEGLSPLAPFSFVGWPYFSTANVSVKKKLVEEWLLDGFDAHFFGAPYEDLEFAYRLSKTKKSFWIFHDPTSAGVPPHRSTLATSMDRQSGVGKALVHLIELHPELAAMCHLQDFLNVLTTPESCPCDRLDGDRRLVMEGVKAWARTLEAEHEIGTEPWHQDFLAAVLELCLLEGFVSAWPRPRGDLTAASALVLDRFCQRMHPALDHELAPWSFLVKGLVPPPDPPILRSAAAKR